MGIHSKYQPKPFPAYGTEKQDGYIDIMAPGGGQGSTRITKSLDIGQIFFDT
jgi:hypothetical protein